VIDTGCRFEGAEGGVVSLTVKVKVAGWDRLPEVPVTVME
jgi:hypothetical protein